MRLYCLGVALHSGHTWRKSLQLMVVLSVALKRLSLHVSKTIFLTLNDEIIKIELFCTTFIFVQRVTAHPVVRLQFQMVSSARKYGALPVHCARCCMADVIITVAGRPQATLTNSQRIQLMTPAKYLLADRFTIQEERRVER